MLTFSTEPWGVTSSSSFDAEDDVVLKVMLIKIVRLNKVYTGRPIVTIRLLNWGGGPADSGFMRQIQVNVTNHFTFKKAKIAKQLHTKKCI